MPRHRQSRCGLAAALAIALLATLAAQSPTPAPPVQRLDGLKEPVDIVRDRWGVSHIYARNEADLFFAQGYNVARDRLFQLELWRRQATGTVAQMLGPAEVERDIGTRLFLFRGDLEQELNWYHPHGAAIVRAFVSGINAYVDETARTPSLLTPEFAMLGIAPGKWTPEVVVSRFNGLLGNATEELNYALAVRTIGAERVEDLESFQPSHPDLRMDPAIDASLLAPEILARFTAFRRPIRFTADELAPAYRGDPGAAGALNASVASGDEPDPTQRRQDIGSNNWVVGGALTQTGLPLIANDPHRVQQVPSLRYWVHLNAPGWNVIGGGEPSLPGVSIGHNEHGGWGLTIFGTDGEDLYVYDTNPANPSEYRYQGAWEPMKVVKDEIAVKGRPAVAVDLKYTRHGPVVYEDPAHHKAYAVRAAWLEPGAAPYLASLRMDQARTWEEFREACRFSRTPAENMVWGDVEGNIGYQAVGISPLRSNWSGLVPVPGDGRYEWNGYLPIAALPHTLNPAKGFWNTSNDYLIPPGWPYREALHYTWADPYRGSRVAERLGSGQRFSLADMVHLQNDDLSIPARTLAPLLRGLKAADGAVDRARRALLDWNYVLDKDSVAAGLYEMWQRRLQANVRALLVPAEAVPYIGSLPMSRTIALLVAPDGRFGGDPVGGRDAVLVRSLEEAVSELAKRLGPEMADWTLGAYHHATIRHVIAAGMSPAARERFDVGDAPRGGDSYTITATGSGDNQASGGSFKIVMDAADWDRSVGLNNPGQSGDVTGPHYRDLYPLWARGAYFPIFFSRAKVDSVAEQVVRLEPAAPRGGGD